MPLHIGNPSPFQVPSFTLVVLVLVLVLGWDAGPTAERAVPVGIVERCLAVCRAEGLAKAEAKQRSTGGGLCRLARRLRDNEFPFCIRPRKPIFEPNFLLTFTFHSSSRQTYATLTDARPTGDYDAKNQVLEPCDQ